MKNELAIDVEDLTVAYESKPVLWDVDFKIPQGKLVAVLGPNGAGKTTMIKSILGLIKPVSGIIKFPILNTNHITNKIAYVPQSGSVDWDFPATVLDIVMMGRYGHIGWFKRPGKIEKQMALETLSKVGMKEYASRQISQLSGGQQQRVFLARALIQQADIYFMDEPFKGVDAQTQDSIVTLLKELKNQGKTVVVVHHDLQTVTEYFDWVTLINLSLVANGETKDVFTEDNLKITYGEKQLIRPKEAI